MATVLAPPPRKPVPGRASSGTPSFNIQAPKLPPAQQSQERLSTRTRNDYSNSASSANNHSPPMSNNISPAYSMTSQNLPSTPQPARRRQSNAASSTSSSNTNGNPSNNGMQRVSTSSNFSTSTSGVRRSTSSRSNSSIPPTSYVALMRKQKGTVWCDRAQNEDPRILAAQRQAKMRAAAEVAGGHGYATQVRTSTSSSGVVGGVRSKIRHHGAPKASAYNAAVMGSSVGVPMRLSASEVDDENDSDEETGAKYHVRNGSGRSSLASGLRGYSHLGASAHGIYTNGSTPPNISPSDGMDNVIEEQTPVPHDHDVYQNDYFTERGGSGNSGEQEESFGTVGGLPQATGLPTAEEKVKRSTADDLRRRGSVDDRTMTMSAGRLFVANPDLSD